MLQQENVDKLGLSDMTTIQLSSDIKNRRLLSSRQSESSSPKKLRYQTDKKKTNERAMSQRTLYQPTSNLKIKDNLGAARARSRCEEDKDQNEKQKFQPRLARKSENIKQHTQDTWEEDTKRNDIDKCNSKNQNSIIRMDQNQNTYENQQLVINEGVSPISSTNIEPVTQKHSSLKSNSVSNRINAHEFQSSRVQDQSISPKQNAIVNPNQTSKNNEYVPAIPPDNEQDIKMSQQSQSSRIGDQDDKRPTYKQQLLTQIKKRESVYQETIGDQDEIRDSDSENAITQQLMNKNNLQCKLLMSNAGGPVTKPKQGQIGEPFELNQVTQQSKISQNKVIGPMMGGRGSMFGQNPSERFSQMHKLQKKTIIDEGLNNLDEGGFHTNRNSMVQTRKQSENDDEECNNIDSEMDQKVDAKLKQDQCQYQEEEDLKKEYQMLKQQLNVMNVERKSSSNSYILSPKTIGQSKNQQSKNNDSKDKQLGQPQKHKMDVRRNSSTVNARLESNLRSSAAAQKPTHSRVKSRIETEMSQIGLVGNKSQKKDKKLKEAFQYAISIKSLSNSPKKLAYNSKGKFQEIKRQNFYNRENASSADDEGQIDHKNLIRRLQNESSIDFQDSDNYLYTSADDANDSFYRSKRQSKAKRNRNIIDRTSYKSQESTQNMSKRSPNARSHKKRGHQKKDSQSYDNSQNFLASQIISGYNIYGQPVNQMGAVIIPPNTAGMMYAQPQQVPIMANQFQNPILGPFQNQAMAYYNQQQQQQQYMNLMYQQMYSQQQQQQLAMNNPSSMIQNQHIPSAQFGQFQPSNNFYNFNQTSVLINSNQNNINSQEVQQNELQMPQQIQTETSEAMSPRSQNLAPQNRLQLPQKQQNKTSSTFVSPSKSFKQGESLSTSLMPSQLNDISYAISQQNQLNSEGLIQQRNQFNQNKLSSNVITKQSHTDNKSTYFQNHDLNQNSNNITHATSSLSLSKQNSVQFTKRDPQALLNSKEQLAAANKNYLNKLKDKFLSIAPPLNQITTESLELKHHNSDQNGVKYSSSKLNLLSPSETLGVQSYKLVTSTNQSPAKSQSNEFQNPYFKNLKRDTSAIYSPQQEYNKYENQPQINSLEQSQNQYKSLDYRSQIRQSIQENEFIDKHQSQTLDQFQFKQGTSNNKINSHRMSSGQIDQFNRSTQQNLIGKMQADKRSTMATFDHNQVSQQEKIQQQSILKRHGSPQPLNSQFSRQSNSLANTNSIQDKLKALNQKLKGGYGQNNQPQFNQDESQQVDSQRYNQHLFSPQPEINKRLETFDSIDTYMKPFNYDLQDSKAPNQQELVVYNNKDNTLVAQNLLLIDFDPPHHIKSKPPLRSSTIKSPLNNTTLNKSVKFEQAPTQIKASEQVIKNPIQNKQMQLEQDEQNFDNNNKLILPKYMEIKFQQRAKKQQLQTNPDNQTQQIIQQDMQDFTPSNVQDRKNLKPAVINQSPGGGRTKEQILDLRKQMMKSKVAVKKDNFVSEQSKDSTSSKTKDARLEVMERLATGKKLSVDTKEMKKLTHKNYENLPEIKQKKEEQLKKEQLKNRQMVARQYAKELEQKRKQNHEKRAGENIMSSDDI